MLFYAPGLLIVIGGNGPLPLEIHGIISKLKLNLVLRHLR
jgi:hypothetical protein